VLVPIPGTVPGVTRELATAATEAVHERGVIVLGTIGTSQEGAPEALAHSLALVAKEIGVDAHHVGDAGYHGVGDPHLLHAYSLAVRGRRHTWRRMALGSRTPQRELLD
jgi:riboflavin synthase